MPPRSLLESVYRRLLREASAPTPDGMGALVVGGPKGGKTVILYWTDRLRMAVTSGSMNAFSRRGGLGELTGHAEDIIVGTVSIAPPGGTTGPCGDAWLVDTIAGPGRGKEMYGLAYAVSPTGRITSSRFEVSPSAGGAWHRAFQAGRGQMQLDDVEDPKTPDPNDDCHLHRPGDEDCGSKDRPWLNWVYAPAGWEEGYLRQVVGNHNELMDNIRTEVPGITRTDVEMLEDKVRKMGNIFFRDVYNEANPDLV